MTSGRATASVRATASGSARSQVRYSHSPAARRSPRATAVTVCPSTTRSRQRRLPTRPLAPVTVIRIGERLTTEPAAVLRLVVLAVRPALDVLPPLRVLDVPADRGLEPLLEGPARGPAELGADPRRVDRVAPVVSRSILDEADEALRLLQRGEEQL